MHSEIPITFQINFHFFGSALNILLFLTWRSMLLPRWTPVPCKFIISSFSSFLFVCVACDVWLNHFISLTLSFLLWILCIKLDTCPSLFRKSIIKFVALWHHLQTHSTYKKPLHECYTSCMSIHKVQQPAKGSSLDVPPAMRRHFRPQVSAGIASLSGHQARQSHLLIPSTRFEMWLITADACSLMFYCLINLSRSLAIRRTIQSSSCSPLRYTEGEEKIPAQAGPIVPLLMAAVNTSSSQMAWDSLAKHAKEMDMFGPHWMHPKSGILNSAYLQ